jgi:arylsulfatase A-like enzyme
MASDTEPVEELDLSTGAGGLKRSGALAGAAGGALVGIADVATALLTGNEVVTPAAAPKVVVAYAIFFAVGGVLAALVARRFEWKRRALSLLVSLGSAAFLVLGWLNVHALPSFTSGLSLFVDVLVLAACVLLFRRAYFGPGADELRLGRWISAGGLAVLVALGLAAIGSGRDAGPVPIASRDEGLPPRPNVLLYVVDTLRADHLGCYGYDKPTSPEIDAFAKDAVRFTDCIAPSSWTKPSMASVLTGMYPSTHQCVQQREVLVPEAETLAEVLRAAGWRTAAFSDNPFISPEFGFAQGFDRFEGVQPSVIANGTLLGKALFMTRLVSLVGRPFGVGNAAGIGVRARQEELLRFVDSATDEPWFAYLHAMEPHLPYDPPEDDAVQFGFPEGQDYEKPPGYGGILPFDVAAKPAAGLTEKLIGQYDGEIRDLSRAFGELRAALEQRGQWDTTIVVLLSDHGEEFRERGGWTHGHSLYRELVHVPLIVRLPDSMGEHAKQGHGRRVQGYATLLDVLPTVVDACGVEFRPEEPRRIAGWSLTETLAGSDKAKPFPAVRAGRAILGEVTMGPVSLRSILDGRWQLIQAAKPLASAEELYDASSDPGQLRPKEEGAAPTERTRLRERLAKAFDALDQVSLSRREREIDGETQQLLEEIGYVGGK